MMGAFFSTLVSIMYFRKVLMGHVTRVEGLVESHSVICLALCHTNLFREGQNIYNKISQQNKEMDFYGLFYFVFFQVKRSPNLMASPFSFCCTKIAPKSFSAHSFHNFQPNFRVKTFKINCKLDNPTDTSSSTQDSQPENLLLKAAWYGSELLGIAASYIRSPKNVGDSPQETPVLALDDGSGVIDRAAVAETIKGDFQRSYFVTGFLPEPSSDVLPLGLLFVLNCFMFLCRKPDSRCI